MNTIRHLCILPYSDIFKIYLNTPNWCISASWMPIAPNQSYPWTLSGCLIASDTPVCVCKLQHRPLLMSITEFHQSKYVDPDIDHKIEPVLVLMDIWGCSGGLMLARKISSKMFQVLLCQILHNFGVRNIFKYIKIYSEYAQRIWIRYEYNTIRHFAYSYHIWPALTMGNDG